jgi:protein TonB
MKRVLLLVVALALVGAAHPAAQDKDVHKSGEAGLTLPVVIKDVKPHYPADASRTTALVVVDCVVTAGGKTSNVHVQKPDDAAFDREAVKALEQWEFKPGTKDGKPVAVAVTVEMTFTKK